MVPKLQYRAPEPPAVPPGPATLYPPEEGPHFLALLRGREAAAFALQIAVLVVTRLLQPTIYTDDAYIHYRNALNFARGDGLVFNPGEVVLATTSPLYAFALGCLHFATRIPLPALGTALGFLADVAILVLLLGWLRRASVPLLARHAIALIVATEPWRMIYSSTGMELGLFLAVALLCGELLVRERAIALGVVLGLIGWLRPEGAVVWVAIAATLALERRFREGVRVFAVAVPLAAAVAALLFFAYGTIVPQSMIAKSRAPWYLEKSGAAPELFFVALGDLTPFTPLNGFRGTWNDLPDRINSSVVSFAQILLVVVGACGLALRGSRRLALYLPLVFAGYFLFYCATNPEIFFWYYVPFFFLGLLLGSLGWWWLIEAVLIEFRARRGWSPLAVRLAAFVALSTLTLLSLLSNSFRSMSFPFRGESIWSRLSFRYDPAEPHDREFHYEPAARVFNEWIAGDATRTVGCIEIGIFGYFYEGRVLDVFGLVSPEALDLADPEKLAELPEDAREFPFNVLLRFRPEYAVSAPVFFRGPPPLFDELYEQVEVPGNALLFYRRRDLAESSAPPRGPSP